jgi:hypothetical protein
LAFTGHYQEVSSNWETEVYKNTVQGTPTDHLCILQYKKFKLWQVKNKKFKMANSWLK